MTTEETINFVDQIAQIIRANDMKVGAGKTAEFVANLIDKKLGIPFVSLLSALKEGEGKLTKNDIAELNRGGKRKKIELDDDVYDAVIERVFDVAEDAVTAQYTVMLVKNEQLKAERDEYKSRWERSYSV